MSKKKFVEHFFVFRNHRCTLLKLSQNLKELRPFCVILDFDSLVLNLPRGRGWGAFAKSLEKYKLKNTFFR
jgi:hypothetical protein